MKFKFLGTLPAFSIGSVESKILVAPDGSYFFPEFQGSQAPTIEVLADCIRCWFSARDINNQSRPFFYELSLDNPLEVLYTKEQPQIDLGAAGHPDENGAMISQVTPTFIHYTGWSKTGRKDVKFRTACMATHRFSGEKFVVYDRTSDGKCGTSMPFKDTDGSWLYMAVNRWEDGEPFYSINCDDKIFGYQQIIPEIAARPVTITIDNTAYMFYSKRGPKNYRTDPAEMYKMYVKPCKADTEELIEVEGDSNPLQAYGYPVKVKDKLYLFYNSGSFTSPIHIAEAV